MTNGLVELLHGGIFEALGWTLVHSLWELAAIAAMCGVLGLLLRTARGRYAVACMGMAAMIIALVITFCCLLWESGPRVNNAQSTNALVELAVHPAIARTNPPSASQVTATMATWQVRARQWVNAWLPVAVMIYLAGAVGFSLRLANGMLTLRKMRHAARPIPGDLATRLSALANRCGMQGVRLLETALLEVPAVVGLLKPVVLLPATAITGLTTDQLQVLVAHELAHLKRWDHVVNHAQAIVEAMLFYHPAVWWVSAWMRREREYCCDDAAMREAGDAHTYAEALEAMEHLRGEQFPALGACGEKMLLLERVQRVLNMPLRVRSIGGLRTGSAVAMVMVAGIFYLVGCAHETVATSSGAAGGVPATRPAAVGQDQGPTVWMEATYLEVADAGKGRPDIVSLSGMNRSDIGSQVSSNQPSAYVPQGVNSRRGTNFAKDVPTGGLSVGFLSNHVDDFLKALQEATHAEVLAKPRVVVFSGNEAHVTIGQTIPYLAGYKAKGDGYEGDVKDFFTGIDLGLTPVITQDGYVRIQIHVKQSELTRMDSVAAPGVPAEKGLKVMVPVINDGATGAEDKRSTTSNVMIKAGNTIVLSGNLVANAAEGKPPRYWILVVTPTLPTTAAPAK